MKNKDKTLTSIKIDPQIFEDFKILTLTTKFGLQKLVDRCMHKYINSEEFKKEMHNYQFSPSGSI